MKKAVALLLCAVLLISGALAADMKSPTGIWANSGAILIADSSQNAIYSIGEFSKGHGDEPELYAGKINPADIYGEPAGGYLDGDALTAQFDAPWDVQVFGDGFVVSDSGNNCLRMIANGKVTTFSGSRIAALTNGSASKAAFNSPRGLARDGATLYVADTLNNCIRAVDEKGNVTTFAGSAEEGYKDGSLTAARFNGPSGIYCYRGDIYVADTGNHCIRMIRDGQVTTIAGQNSGVYEDSSEKAGGFADGWAENALFRSPLDVWADAGGVYIADTGNSALRLLKNGWVATLAADEDGLSQPAGLAFDDSGLYVTDRFSGEVFIAQFANSENLFSDVPAGSWYAEYVSLAVDFGLFNGVSETAFDPNGSMQRGMIAAVLARAAQIPNRDLIIYGEKTFSDVPADAYYKDSLAWCADSGIISGIGNGEFAPTSSATRQETVTMLYRLAGVMGRDVTASASLAEFADGADVADFAKTAMEWAVSKKIISGNEQKQLLPAAEMTRAQAAKIFSEFAMQK